MNMLSVAVRSIAPSSCKRSSSVRSTLATSGQVDRISLSSA